MKHFLGLSTCCQSAHILPLLVSQGMCPVWIFRVRVRDILTSDACSDKSGQVPCFASTSITFNTHELPPNGISCTAK